MTNREAIGELNIIGMKLNNSTEEAYPESDEQVAISIAIKALEQLDKIRGIVSKSEYPREDVIRYKMICEVLGEEHV